MASDADGDTLSFIVTAPPLHGILVVQATTGASTYTPSPGYCGPDSFKFTASDGMCTSVEATVSINVSCDTPTPTSTSTSSPTPTPTVTPTSTPTPVPQGGSCTNSLQCLTGLFCVDTFCCDQPCDVTFDRCDLPGREGTCTDTRAAVPATSSASLSGIALLLLVVGIFGVLRMQRYQGR
jgi:hypothetical protein